ncbi:unnamed protein product [Ostreobium quekettii]|uniref:Homeobox domain-containing protein n=1 Tax=Ostreobium quekettii TaxID=121088 RepID=A0A8S1JCG3_9CHLO|nr:unnamed protein product [Ostreobium quekettii]|eukprot:evm.model.scf_792.7 EVM.evm.TU.scf_792.7   scf_792:53016-58923(-)
MENPKPMEPLEAHLLTTPSLLTPARGLRGDGAMLREDGSGVAYGRPCPPGDKAPHGPADPTVRAGYVVDSGGLIPQAAASTSMPLGQIQQHRQDNSGRWRYAVNQAILQHTVGIDDGTEYPKSNQPSEDEVQLFMSSLGSPMFLSKAQKHQLTEVLTNMEGWWKQSLPAMETLSNDSSAVLGTGGPTLPPVVFPMRLRHRMAVMANATAALLRLPDAPCDDNGNSMHRDGNQTSQEDGWTPGAGPVALLRHWMMQHFVHPYPTPEEKEMLARTTGMSPKQVSNWFINARVRIWQPLVKDLARELQGCEDEDEIR